MENEVQFHVNYYIGAILVESGELRMSGTHIIFKPTGVIERLMASKEVVIALADIIAYEYTGGLFRTVRIQTREKIYKFEGSATSKFGDVLLNLLPNKAAKKPSKVQVLTPTITQKYACSECSFVAQPGIRYCPRCGAPPKNACQKCRFLLDTSWIFCVYCGTKVEPVSNSASPLQQRRAA